jgi:uncharacterized protein
VRALYLETSAVARAYLEQEPHALEALQRAQVGRQLFTSALMEVELRRAVLRLRAAPSVLQNVLELLHQVDVVPLGPAVLARAGDVFPLNVRSLDAIHLATAVILHQDHEVEEVVMFSRDKRVRDNATALGLQLA